MSKKDVSFFVNIESPTAVYVQIENQIQFAIAAGVYEPGDTLPSVRDMSERLEINPNTVTKAYRDLELMQLVHTRRGVGVTVAAEAPELCKTKVPPMVNAHLVDAVAECLACGYPKSEINKLVSDAIAAEARPYQEGNGR